MARSTLPFFLAAFAITWLLQAPALLALHGVIAGPPDRFMGLVGLGALGPMLAAIAAARLEQRGGVGMLFGQLRLWRVHAVWYAVALLTPGALFTAGMGIYSLFGGEGPFFYPPNDAPRWLALIFFPIGEEVGWRGFALPRLQARYGPIRASGILGVCWCAWHAPMFNLAGIPLTLLLGLLPFFIAGSVFFTWLWNRTGGSLLIAVLAHVGAHLNNSNRPLPGNATPAIVHSLAYVVFAVVLLAVDRAAFKRKAC